MIDSEGDVTIVIPRTTIRVLVVTCLITWCCYITVVNYFAATEVDRQRDKISELESKVHRLEVRARIAEVQSSR